MELDPKQRLDDVDRELRAAAYLAAANRQVREMEGMRLPPVRQATEMAQETMRLHRASTLELVASGAYHAGQEVVHRTVELIRRAA